MTGSVWPEVAHQLITRVDNLFSPGNPDMFHANYTVTLSFLTRLEGMSYEIRSGVVLCHLDAICLMSL